MPNAQNITEIYLDVEQVARRYKVSTDTIYRWKREGQFPKAKKFSRGCVRWSIDDLVKHENTLDTCFVGSAGFPFIAMSCARP